MTSYRSTGRRNIRPRLLAQVVILTIVTTLSTVVATAPETAAAFAVSPPRVEAAADAATDGAQPYRPLPDKAAAPAKRSASTRPDFGPDDKLSAAWAAGKISVDQYVRWSVQRIGQPELLPPQLRPSGPLPESTGLSLGYALSLADRVTPETRSWLQDALPAPSRSHVTVAPSGSAPSTASVGSWLGCEFQYTFAGYVFDCRLALPTTPPIYLHYNIDGISWYIDEFGLIRPLPGLPASDTNANGVPDGADLMASSMTTALQRYKSWGYQLTGANVQVYVGVDSFDNPGITFPTGDLFNGGPVILLPSNPGSENIDNYTYLPRHELFHAFQYHYMSVSHFSFNVTEINWWMEATAEWATHRLYDEADFLGSGWRSYARNVGSFLGQPTLPLNAHDGLGGSRQYGAFLLPQYLTERTDANFVLRTWQQMEDQLPVDVIGQVLGGYGRTWATELPGFAAANYRLTGASTDLTAFFGASDGYRDGDASGLWRSNLANQGGRPARAFDWYLASGTVPNGSTQVSPGGTAYVDLTPPWGEAGTVRADVDMPLQDGWVAVQYLLVVWDNLTARTPRRWDTSEGRVGDSRHVLSVPVNPGEVATLMAVRTDVYADLDIPQAAPARVNVSAWFTPGADPVQAAPNSALNHMWASYANGTGYLDMCATWSGGDGTQSIVLPSGRRTWFFSDTYLGDTSLRPTFDKSILRNSMVVQTGTDPSTARLNTVTGGNTCHERDTSLPLEQRYAYSPVRTNTTGPDIGGEYYWSMAGKVHGASVVWFYLRGQGMRFTNSSMAVIPIDALERGGPVNAVPIDLPARNYYGTDNPIVWGSSVVDDSDGYTYIYGWAVVDDQHRKKPFLARVPRASLTDFNAWRFYRGDGKFSTDGGSAGQAQAVPLNTPFTDPMFSVVRLNGRHWLVTLDPTTHNIVAYPSTTRWGFTTARVDLYDTPEAIQQGPEFKLIYDLHVQPGLSSDSGSLVVSYNVNSTGVNIGCRPEIDYVTGIYRARFVNLPKAAFDPAKASTAVTTFSQPTVSASGPDVRAGRGIRIPPPRTQAPPVPKKPSKPSAAGQRSSAIALSSVPSTITMDTSYYNSWSYHRDIDRQNRHEGCPYLPAPTGLTSEIVNEAWGWVKLDWNPIGPDVGYKIYEFNVTENQKRKWPWDWTFGPPRTIGALDAYPADRADTYEWFLVPVNIWGQPETSQSNKTRSMMPL